ncbi:MarR family transcriptional regulator [Leptospira sp. 201903071]|uniref:MarR family winged helix-turn-helix transcriptional regulator n=1 Tax=Leptospira ainazelensis TaxID=2810034 RepID=UPI001965CAE6|nr:MarR family transcriptional regulator [Leptospira ainazelensis]MBM9502663.1 MarR family transcriptional regulator [Leptospira ainazelensis]
MNDFQIEKTLGYRINRCAIVMKQELQERFSQAGFTITPEEWIILNRLWENDGMTQNELSQKTLKDKTTVTRFLNAMEKDGLIRRVPSTTDRRNNHVNLTSRGKKLKEELIPIAKSLLNDAAKNLDPKAFEITLDSLMKIEKNLSIFKTTL